MKVSAIPKNNYYNANIPMPKTNRSTLLSSQKALGVLDSQNTLAFKANLFANIKGLYSYIKAQKNVDDLYRASMRLDKPFLLRDFCMEPFEGIQFGIKAFEGLSMKDIQYMSENLHVIAVKRGCKNGCAYCYADAKPSRTEMSWEEFSLITRGYKKLRERFHGLDLFGENLPTKDPIFKTTELFYDADCMDLAIRDKSGKVYDFIDLSTELFEGLGRVTVFDTSGWYRNNLQMQARAEKYVEHFADPLNMQKLENFSYSFNLFNASYVASVKALKKGDKEKAARLRERFTDNAANVLYTFTPLIEDSKFSILARCLNSKGKDSKYFSQDAMLELNMEVINKLSAMYSADFNGAQKYIKSEEDMRRVLAVCLNKLMSIDTGINSAGRMKQFLQEFDLKANLQDHNKIIPSLKSDLETYGRYHKYLAFKLIDADGKVYHMNYAWFVPTEMQLNIVEKEVSPPKLANILPDFIINKDLINRPEQWIIKNF